MKFILGKKIEMSQKFDEEGALIPVTLIKAGPCTVTQVKTKDKDSYGAVQIGFESKKKLGKPLGGHLKNLENFRYLCEFRCEPKDWNRGKKIDVSVFSPGELVQVTGVSKGKGFAGVVKRHGFHGQPSSHGHKDQLRMPGSIGATNPQRVTRGRRMAGRMGGDQVTVKNLKVIEVDKEKNLLVLKGAVPGARNSLLEIQSIK
jgi:large subunit ribosomal protein L3